MIKQLFSKLMRFRGLKDFKPVFNFFNYVTGNGGKDRKDFYYGLVFRCVDAIATSVAMNQFDLYQINKDGEAKKNMSHKAVQVLRRPNKFQTGVDFLYLVSSHIDAFGVAYVYPVKAMSNEPTELWTLDPARISVVRGDEFIKGYIYTNPKGEKIPFATDELFEVKRPHPFDLYEGVSTIEMAKLTIEGDLNAQLWNRNFFKNGAIPSGVLTTETNLGDEEFERVKEQFHEKYEGKENAYKTLVLEGGLKYQQLALNQKDMDFLEQRKFHRDEILSIFQVPKTIVAVTDDVNRANAETSEYVFAKRTIKPRLELIFEKLNIFYLPMFKGTEGFDLRFDDPVPADRAQELQEDAQLVNRVFTINEIRAKRGYEPLEGGDELYLNLALATPLADTNTANPQKAIQVKGSKTTNDRKLLRDREKFLVEKEKAYRLKLAAHWDFLIKDIESGKQKKAGPGVEELLDTITPNMNEWAKTTAEITLSFNQSTFMEAVKQTGEIYGLPTAFNLEHSGAIAWLSGRSKQTADNVRDSLLNRSREVIARNLADNTASVAKIRQEVADVFKDEKDWRINRIVQNELVGAYNEGSYRTYQASDLVEQTTWITASDERVCPICEPNDGEHVKIGETFASGDDKPQAHIGCRCQVVPYFA